MFFALHGANFNGNMFALQALENGAEYVIVDEDIPVTCSQNACYGNRLIRVDNTLLALQDLARTWCRQWREANPARRVIGITGTNGKTTTKELTAAVLSTRYNLLYTQGNLNNQVGVPLTLLQLNHKHELALVEMGASHPGDIKELVDIAEPDCGIITNVGKAHLLGFGSFEGVQNTKAELYDFLENRAAADGHKSVIFRNLDNPYLADMANKHAPRVQTVGYHTGTMPKGTHLTGAYNSENIQAALTIGRFFGVSEDEAMRAVCNYEPHNNRSQLIESGNNTIVVDAYNANPTSMHAAIESFISTFGNTDRNVFILGDMLELGEYSLTEHQNIVNMLEELKADNVMLTGTEFGKTTARYPVFKNAQELADYLNSNPLYGRNILLKGSRGIRLETVIDSIK